MPDMSQFDMIKTHIGAAPPFGHVTCAGDAFWRVVVAEYMVRRKMRLADDTGGVARRRKRPGKTLLPQSGIKVDTVVMHAMRARQ